MARYKIAETKITIKWSVLTVHLDWDVVVKTFTKTWPANQTLDSQPPNPKPSSGASLRGGFRSSDATLHKNIIEPSISTWFLPPLNPKPLSSNRFPLHQEHCDTIERRKPPIDNRFNQMQNNRYIRT